MTREKKSPARSEVEEAKRKVLAVYPMALCTSDYTDSDCWSIVRNEEDGRYLGTGQFEDVAWINAAARLSHPRGERCVHGVWAANHCWQCGPNPPFQSAKSGEAAPAEAIQEVELCDTTATPRAAAHWCVCITRTNLMGPCMTWCLGSNGRCAYCDHEFYCHKMLMAAQGKAIEPKTESPRAEGVKNPKACLHGWYRKECPDCNPKKCGRCYCINGIRDKVAPYCCCSCHEPVESQPSSPAGTFESWWREFKELKHRPPLSQIGKVAEAAWNAAKQSQPVIEPLVSDEDIENAIDRIFSSSVVSKMAKELQRFRKAQKDLGK